MWLPRLERDHPMTLLHSASRIPRTDGMRRTLPLWILVLSISWRVDAQTPTDIAFPSQGHTLMGKFYAGSGGSTRPTVLLLQGFPGNDRDVLGMGRSLSDSGYNVMVFNYSGTHQSEGVFDIRTAPQDIEAAFIFVRSPETAQRFHVDPSRIILGGYSFGGGMALAYAATHADIPAVFSIAGTDHAELLREYRSDPALAARLDSLFDLMKRPTGPVNFEGKEALKKMAQLPTAFDFHKGIPELVRRHVLLVGGTDDMNVALERHILPFYRIQKQLHATDTRLITFQTDHQFRNVRQELAAALLTWLQNSALLDLPAKPE